MFQILIVCGRLIKSFPLIGTHEIQTCVANNCSRPGIVSISCSFSENSKAKGYLSILCLKTNSSQERFVVANRTSSSELKLSVSGLFRHNYTVVVFDIQSNGLPVLSDDSNPYVLAAEEENITVTNPAEAGGKGYQLQIWYYFSDVYND